MPASRHIYLFSILGSSLVHQAMAPFQNCTPRIPNTSKKSKMISMTLSRLGMDRRRELTTVLIPSFLLTILSGLRALSALKPLTKEMSKPERL